MAKHNFVDEVKKMKRVVAEAVVAAVAVQKVEGVADADQFEVAAINAVAIEQHVLGIEEVVGNLVVQQGRSEQVAVTDAGEAKVERFIGTAPKEFETATDECGAKEDGDIEGVDGQVHPVKLVVKDSGVVLSEIQLTMIQEEHEESVVVESGAAVEIPVDHVREASCAFNSETSTPPESETAELEGGMDVVVAVAKAMVFEEPTVVEAEVLSGASGPLASGSETHVTKDSSSVEDEEQEVQVAGTASRVDFDGAKVDVLITEVPEVVYAEEKGTDGVVDVKDSKPTSDARTAGDIDGAAAETDVQVEAIHEGIVEIRELQVNECGVIAGVVGEGQGLRCHPKYRPASKIQLATIAEEEEEETTTNADEIAGVGTAVEEKNDALTASRTLEGDVGPVNGVATQPNPQVPADNSEEVDIATLDFARIWALLDTPRTIIRASRSIVALPTRSWSMSESNAPRINKIFYSEELSMRKVMVESVDIAFRKYKREGAWAGERDQYWMRTSLVSTRSIAAPQKSVVVRYTTDGWKSWEEVAAALDTSTNSSHVDRYVCDIDLDEVLVNAVVGAKYNLEFAVRHETQWGE
ncbi:hypothetical protein HK102_004142, partial [Quaeritorhiza haematococci]